MSRKKKLLKRLLSRPKDLTFEEVVTLLSMLGFELENKGKTSGSRVMFRGSNGYEIDIHKPHPKNILKNYQIDQIIEVLNSAGLLEGGEDQ